MGLRRSLKLWVQSRPAQPRSSKSHIRDVFCVFATGLSSEALTV
jgi:hypothetical protein